MLDANALSENSLGIYPVRQFLDEVEPPDAAADGAVGLLLGHLFPVQPVALGPVERQRRVLYLLRAEQDALIAFSNAEILDMG